VTAWRWDALDSYMEQPLPDRAVHLWRYSDPRRLLPQSLLETPLGPDASAAIELPEKDPAVLLLPGRPPQLNDAARRLAIEIVPLAEMPAVSEQLGDAVPFGHGMFEALNGAVWNCGLAVRIPGGVRLERPLRLIQPAVSEANLPRILVLAGEGCEATVVEEFCGGDNDVDSETHVVGVTELKLAPGANLRHVILQNWPDGVAGHLTSRAQIDSDASLFTVIASFGGAMTKLDTGAVLVGRGARSELVGVVLGEGEQHFDHHTLHEHRAPETFSNLDFKVAVTGRSRSVYTGLIRIDERAPDSEAFQENRNLMLSSTARVDTIPELEILTDEVSCSHGATAAPVDDEQMFYLRSRGIGETEALRLIVGGFLKGTLRRIPASLWPTIETLVDDRLTRLVKSKSLEDSQNETPEETPDAGGES